MLTAYLINSVRTCSPFAFVIFVVNEYFSNSIISRLIIIILSSSSRSSVSEAREILISTFSNFHTVICANYHEEMQIFPMSSWNTETRWLFLIWLVRCLVKDIHKFFLLASEFGALPSCRIRTLPSFEFFLYSVRNHPHTHSVFLYSSPDSVCETPFTQVLCTTCLFYYMSSSMSRLFFFQNFQEYFWLMEAFFGSGHRTFLTL